MPRNLTPEVLAKLASGSFMPALFVQLEFENEMVNLWSGIGTITPFSAFQAGQIITVGPNTATFGAIFGSGLLWTNPAGVTGSGVASVTTSGLIFPTTQWLQANKFGLSVPHGFQVVGIEFTFDASKSPAGTGTFTAQILKGLNLAGTPKVFNPTGTLGPITLGGLGDTWGVSWLDTDLNSDLFGIAFQGKSTGPVNTTFDVATVQTKIYLQSTLPMFPYGQSWIGMGWLGQVPSIPEVTDVVAENITLTLSGIPVELLSDAISYVRQYSSATIWLGFMSGPQAVITDPVQVFQGHLDIPTVTEGATTCSIAITAENPLIDLNRSPNRRFTDVDQQLDFPGDMGFAAVGSLQGLYLGWPLYPLKPGGGIGP